MRNFTVKEYCLLTKEIYLTEKCKQNTCIWKNRSGTVLYNLIAEFNNKTSKFNSKRIIYLMVKMGFDECI